MSRNRQTIASMGAATLAALLAAGLAGCNTVKGMGEDLEAAGEAGEKAISKDKGEESSGEGESGHSEESGKDDSGDAEG